MKPVMYTTIEEFLKSIPKDNDTHTGKTNPNYRNEIKDIKRTKYLSRSSNPKVKMDFE